MSSNGEANGLARFADLIKQRKLYPQLAKVGSELLPSNRMIGASSSNKKTQWSLAIREKHSLLLTYQTTNATSLLISQLQSRAR